MNRLETVALKDLRRDGGTQSRARDDQAAIADYGEAYKRGDKIPPLRAVWDGKVYWLYGGHHRIGGALLAGVAAVEVEVTDGTLADAKWLALSENKDHGIRRTNDDKRHAVKLALQQRPNMSDRAIAEYVGVGHPLVADVRKQLEEIPVEKRTGIDGKQRATPKKPTPPAPESNGKRTSKAEPHEEYDDVQQHPDEDVPARQVETVATSKPVVAGPVDHEGNAIPEPLRDVFADTWLTDAIATLHNWHNHATVSPILSGIRKRFDHYPWLRLQDAIFQLEQIDHEFELTLETLRQAVPYAVCEPCAGAGCDHCQHSGYLPQWKWEELQGGGK